MKAELVLGNLKRERDALENKLERLANALSKDWQDVDQEYLCTQQYNAMSLYAHILDERIIDIEDKLEQKRLEAEEKAAREAILNDETIFKKDIDLGSYKKHVDMNNLCKDEKCACNKMNSEDIIKYMLEDIFGFKVIYED